MGWRWSDGGVWLAVLAIAVGAGDLGLELVTRAMLFGAHSTMLVGGPIAGAAPVTVAVLGLLVAVLGRLGGLMAALRGEAVAGRAAVLGLGAGVGVLMLLRLHAVLVLAPTLMAGLVVVGGVVALWAAVMGLRGRGDEGVVRVVQAQLGLCLLALGFGAWVPALGLLVGCGVAGAAMVLAWGSGVRWSRWASGLALAGALPCGAGLWAGELGGSALMFMSAWSPWINFAAAVVCAAVMLAIGGSIGHVLRDRSPGHGGPELALGAGVLAVGAVAIGAIDVPGLEATLRAWVWPEFAASWLLRDDYGLGPLPGYRVELARYGVVVAVLLAGLGMGLAGRLRGWALALPELEMGLAGLRRRARALIAGAHEVVELRALAVLLVPGSPGLGRAAGRGDLQAALVIALFGAIAVLAVVFANPDVVQVGPSRVYPVDVGGLDPALLGSQRRGAKGAKAEEAAPGAAASELAPGTGDAAAARELAPGTGDAAAAEGGP